MTQFRSSSLGQFESSLTRYQYSSPKHQIWISRGSPVQAANTKHESVAVAQSRRNLKALLNLNESVEAERSSWNTVRSSQTHSFLWSYDKQKINEDQQSIAKWTNSRASSHCLSGYTYILSKHHVSSEASGATKHYMPFHKTVHKNTTCLCHQNVLSHASFSKTPSHETASKKHHMTQLSFPRKPQISPFRKGCFSIFQGLRVTLDRRIVGHRHCPEGSLGLDTSQQYKPRGIIGFLECSNYGCLGWTLL